MATKTRQQLSNEISDLCDQAGCNDKIRKVHSSQYVDRGWNPHPPQRFINWWGMKGKAITEKQTDKAWQDVDAIRAFNCEDAREVYRQTKMIGAI